MPELQAFWREAAEVLLSIKIHCNNRIPGCLKVVESGSCCQMPFQEVFTVVTKSQVLAQLAL